jgi:curli production assembly/transport component CsgF
MKRFLLTVILAFLSCSCLQADELVYEPVNPAFGGKPTNGTWLLANAQAQNNIDDPDLEDRADKTAGEVFNETFERLLMRSTANALIDKLTNSDSEDVLLDTEIDMGDYTLLLETLDEGATLQITVYDEITDTTTIYTTSSEYFTL